MIDLFLLCFMKGLSAHRAVNTLHFGYTNLSINAVHGKRPYRTFESIYEHRVEFFIFRTIGVGRVAQSV